VQIRVLYAVALHAGERVDDDAWPANPEIIGQRRGHARMFVCKVSNRVHDRVAGTRYIRETEEMGAVLATFEYSPAC